MGAGTAGAQPVDRPHSRPPRPGNTARPRQRPHRRGRWVDARPGQARDPLLAGPAARAESRGGNRGGSPAPMHARCRHPAHPKAICSLCPPGEEPCRSSCSRCLHPAHKGGPCELCPPRTNRAFCSAFCWRCRHAGTDAEHKATGCGRCPAGDACHSAKLVPADAPADSSVGADLPMASPCRSPAGCSPGRSCSPSGCSDGSEDPTFRSPRRCGSRLGRLVGRPRLRARVGG
mmetsp:Transcript_46921/g.109448  ORF Transcript_46921/g.109448 Transcript_46921/m.109448 type:complete len:232 (-) Transcript_46921:276-971(-)